MKVLKTKEGLRFHFSRDPSWWTPFKYIIKKEELKPQYIYADWNRIYIYTNDLIIYNLDPNLPYLNSIFENPWGAAYSSSSDSVFPTFLFPFMVLSFLKEASKFINIAKRESLIEESTNFDPSFSPIFFLQLAYRLSYALLGHDYEEERGKLKIEEIKQRCIIEDYWNSFLEIRPTDCTNKSLSMLRTQILIEKNKKFILPLKQGSTLSLASEEIDPSLDANKQYFFFLSKLENSTDILYTYLPNLPANKENPYYLCEYQDSLEIMPFHLGIQVEERFGRKNIPKMPEKLVTLLEKSLEQGLSNFLCLPLTENSLYDDLPSSLKLLYEKEVNFFFFVIKNMIMLKEKEKMEAYLKNIMKSIENTFQDIEESTIEEKLILYNTIFVLRNLTYKIGYGYFKLLSSSQNTYEATLEREFFKLRDNKVPQSHMDLYCQAARVINAVLGGIKEEYEKILPGYMENQLAEDYYGRGIEENNYGEHLLNEK